MKDKTVCKDRVKRKLLPSKFTTVSVLLLVLLTSLVLCHCSKTVDMLIPGDGDQLVSAQGTCVACHSNANMVDLVAKPIPPPAEGGEG